MKDYSVCKRILSIFQLAGIFAIAVSCYGGELTPIERATHIIHGKVEATECKSAGGLISVSETHVRVWEILKNSDHAMKTGDLIKIITPGCVDEDFHIESSEVKTVLFETGAELILPLTKYFNHFRLFDPLEPFAIGTVYQDQVMSYDPTTLKNVNAKSARARFIANQNMEWRMHDAESGSDIFRALNEDQFFRNTTKGMGIDKIREPGTYSEIIAQKADFSGVAGMKYSQLVVKVKVLSATPFTKGGSDYVKCGFESLQDIKGRIGSQRFELTLPGATTAANFGFRLPEVGQVGLLALAGKGKVIPIPQYFQPLDAEEALSVGSSKFSANQWKQILREEQ